MDISFEPGARHYFIDIEALGPPGQGSPFALGIVEFDPAAGEIISRLQLNLLMPCMTANGPTIRWLADQPGILDQLKDCVEGVWPHSLLVRSRWDRHGENLDGVPRDYLWADDWADFAWLSEHVPDMRDHFICIDTSIIDMQLEDWQRNTNLRNHVAVDDAEDGMRRLLFWMGKREYVRWSKQLFTWQHGNSCGRVGNTAAFIQASPEAPIRALIGDVEVRVVRAVPDNISRLADGELHLDYEGSKWARNGAGTIRRFVGPRWAAAGEA